MKTCKTCCHLGEVVGGNNLVPWCQIKNCIVSYPHLEGRFCQTWKEVPNGTLESSQRNDGKS